MYTSTMLIARGNSISARELPTGKSKYTEVGLKGLKANETIIKMVFSACLNNIIVLTSAGRLLPVTPCETLNPRSSENGLISISQSGRYMATTTGTSSVHIYNLVTGASFVCPTKVKTPITMAWHPDEGTLFVGDYAGLLTLIKASNGTEQQVVEGHRRDITCIAVGEGPGVLTGSRDSTVRLWNSEFGSEALLLNTTANNGIEPECLSVVSRQLRVLVAAYNCINDIDLMKTEVTETLYADNRIMYMWADPVGTGWLYVDLGGNVIVRNTKNRPIGTWKEPAPAASTYLVVQRPIDDLFKAMS